MAVGRNIVVSVITRVLVCAGVLLLAGGIFWTLWTTKPKPASSDMASAAPRVLVMRARPVPVRRQWEGFGTAAALDSANVPARVTATVIERPEEIRAGQPVQKGQLLVRLDESDFARQVEISSQAITEIDAQLARLQVEERSWSKRTELAGEDVRLARAEYERVRRALEQEAARQRELDQAQQALNTAQQAEVATREEFDKIGPRRASLQAQRQSQEASMRLATLNVERSRIVSPLEGILQTVDVEVGESVAPGQRVARVVNLQRIEAPLLLPAAARPFVSVGDPVLLSDGGATPQSCAGRVVRIAPEDDELTRTMRVFVEVQQQVDGSNVLAPGAFVQGVVTSSFEQMHWLAPRRALNGERIFLIENGLIRSRAIDVDFHWDGEAPSLGLPDRQWVVLKEPLPENALVVVEGSRALPEGSPAIAIEPKQNVETSNRQDIETSKSENLQTQTGVGSAAIGMFLFDDSTFRCVDLWAGAS